MTGNSTMMIETLKNFGKPFFDILYELPPELIKRVESILLEELRRELGYLNLAKLVWNVKKEIARLKDVSWPNLNPDQTISLIHFYDAVKKTALIKKLADMAGMEAATGVHRRLFDRIGHDLIRAMFPSVDEFRACGDVFTGLKKYCRAAGEANIRAGTHVVEIVEQGQNTFIFRVRFCFLQAMANEAGDSYLCYPSSCSADEMFFPGVCKQAGIAFGRDGTLATGEPSCDFVFSRD